MDLGHRHYRSTALPLYARFDGSYQRFAEVMRERDPSAYEMVA